MKHFRVRYTVCYEYDVVATSVAEAASQARYTFSSTPNHKQILAVFPVDAVPPDTSFSQWYMRGKRKRERGRT